MLIIILEIISMGKYLLRLNQVYTHFMQQLNSCTIMAAQESLFSSMAIKRLSQEKTRTLTIGEA